MQRELKMALIRAIGIDPESDLQSATINITVDDMVTVDVVHLVRDDHGQITTALNEISKEWEVVTREVKYEVDATMIGAESRHTLLVGDAK